MINASRILDTKFSADQTSVEVTHEDGTIAVYTDDDLFTICEEILSPKYKKIVKVPEGLPTYDKQTEPTQQDVEDMKRLLKSIQPE